MTGSILDKLGCWWNKGRPACDPPPQRGSAFALVGCQRSGTHLLRELLNSHPAVAVQSETLSPYPQPVYWQNYIRRLPKHLYPPQHPGDAKQLIDQYFGNIRRDVARNPEWYGGEKPRLRMVGIDIKYNQLRRITPVFCDLARRPFFLDYLGSRGIPVVHIVRANVVQTALSIVIANARNVWQNYADNPRNIDRTLRIDPTELLNYIRWVVTERDEFIRLTGDLCVHECRYEDLVRDLGRVEEENGCLIGTHALQALAAFLNVPNEFQYLGNIRKAVDRPYAEFIENYDELLAAVASSEFSSLLQAA